MARLKLRALFGGGGEIETGERRALDRDLNLLRAETSQRRRRMPTTVTKPMMMNLMSDERRQQEQLPLGLW